MTDEEPLEPSGIAQFVEHDRCPRYLKQRVDPGDEPEARDWREAFGLMNIALLGHGREFEATQVEALAANATTVIGPSLDATAAAGVPDITVDEVWVDSPRGRRAQLHAAVEYASTLTATDDEVPYVLLYQAPLDGHLGSHDSYGDADCIVLAPAEAVAQPSSSATQEPRPSTATTTPIADTLPTHASPTTADVVARVIDCKSAQEEQLGHRVQVATYCALLERTLAEGPAELACHIEASVLTQASAVDSDDTSSPFDLPTFRREEWEVFVSRLLAESGPVSEALTDDLAALPFSLDQVCNNCAYKEACMTRAVEDPTAPASLALLGLDASVQRTLQNGGITSLRDLSELLPRPDHPTPTANPPHPTLPAATQRTLEEALPGPIHETVLRAQALRGELDPDYPGYRRPPAIPGTDWVPLPDDRCEGWGNLEQTDAGTLIHVAIFVRPDATIDRLAALGACVYADAHDEYHTIGEVIDAVPDDPETATAVERDLLECFLGQVSEAIETVATALGTPENAVIHCYTYSAHEREALAEGLERHPDSRHARAFRALVSLHPEGHTGPDQAMVSAVQPILNEHFALLYPSQGLLTVVDQFLPTWTIEAFDPLDARPDAPPLRAIFREQFLNERVPYVESDPGIHLHLAHGPLAEGPAAEAADTDAANPSPAGWYPVRKRSGGQFPIEYIWAATPRNPDDAEPRLRPAVVEEWAVEEDTKPLYRQEITRFYYRTHEHAEPLQQADIEYLAKRLAYALLRLVEAIPYKDAYLTKEPLDVTHLTEFAVPVTDLPAAARDYLRMEHGASRDATLAHYRQPLRDRVRSGRSIPLRCTDYETRDDGSLELTGELAYDRLFEDPATAARMQRQARLRSSSGPGGGSWRVLSRCVTTSSAAVTGESEWDAESECDADSAPIATAPGDDAQGRAQTPGTGPSARDHLATDVGGGDPETIQHSPPVLVEEFDQQAGTITLRAFPHRFRSYGSAFRVDHCGWQSPAGSNLSAPADPPADRPGYVAGRDPVWIDTDDVYVLDPMVDDFGAPKADRALTPDTIDHNHLWQTLRAIRQTGQHPPAVGGAPAAIETFLDRLAETDGCLTPNDDQAAFIRAVDRAIVPLQGPPGTGKTSGAIAPALLGRAFAHAQHGAQFLGVVVAPSHEAVDAVLGDLVDLLDAWRATNPGLEALDLVRVLPTDPPPAAERVDTAAPTVSVRYANYHTTAGHTTLRQLTEAVCVPGSDSEPGQSLLCVTPATLYQTLGVIADHHSGIDGDTAPAAMRHADGLADVVCVDEASMLDLPRLLLAGSVLRPTGQTLLVGDHRQLTTVTEVDWAETLRKPIHDTQVHRSALGYVRWLNATVSASTGVDTSEQPEPPAEAPTQAALSVFDTQPPAGDPESGGDPS